MLKLFIREQYPPTSTSNKDKTKISIFTAGNLINNKLFVLTTVNNIYYILK